jgi:hypothetical protein
MAARIGVAFIIHHKPYAYVFESPPNYFLPLRRFHAMRELWIR